MERRTDAWTGETYEGGATVTVDAPLDRIPLFLRDGARLPVAEQPRGGAGPGRDRPLGRGAVGQPPLTVRLSVRKSRPPADEVIS